MVAALLAGYAIPLWQMRPLRAQAGFIGGDVEAGATIEVAVSMVNAGWLPRRQLALIISLRPGRRAAVEAGAFAARIRGRSQTEVLVRLRLPARGVYVAQAARIESAFPLGFFTCRRSVPAAGRITVLPRRFAVAAPNLAGQQDGFGAGVLAPRAGGDGDFSALREYVAGDAPRGVHWPTSARLGELHVVVRERTVRPLLCVVLDTRAKAHAGNGEAHSFEVAVRIAASLAHWATERQIGTQLVVLGARPVVVEAAASGPQALLIQRALAAAEAQEEAPMRELLRRAMPLVWPHAHRYVIFAEGEERSADRSEDAIAALAVLGLEGAVLTALCLHRESFAGVAMENASVLRRRLAARCVNSRVIGRDERLERLFA